VSRIGFYPGSFDPLTNGHIDVIAAAASLCDTLVIGIGTHPSKAPMFTTAERLSLIEVECRPLAEAKHCALAVTTFDGLAVRAAEAAGAALMIRGLRDGSDLDYELQLAGMNAVMAPGLQTVLLPPTSRTRHITATLVRQIARLRGDVTPFVPVSVAAALADKADAERA
jgi:pantetheine-phosphate adenylyltransferase